MPQPEPWELSAVEVTRRVRQGETTALEVVEATLDRIANRNERTNAFVTVCGDQARQAARETDRRREEGKDVGPLHGVPIALKDIEGIKAGVRHTFGSIPFQEWVPDRTAPIVERLEGAGAIVVGKTNAPEFGHLGSTDNRVFGPTSTPFDPSRNAGGSSGGSAAAVADGLVPIAQGSDIGGSLRVPAAFCGVIGFKPTFGRVPTAARPDGFGHHTPMNHVGPLTRTVEDAALALKALSGPGEWDPFSLPDDGFDPQAGLERSLEELTVGFSPDLGGFPVEETVAEPVASAVDALEDAGASVERVEFELPASREHVFEAFSAAAATYMAAMADGIGGPKRAFLEENADELSPTFRALLTAGREISALQLRRVDRMRTGLFDHLQAIFEEVDVLATPTTGVEPFENADHEGEITLGPSEVDGERVDPALGWALTYPFNMTGHPAASLPAGLTSNGLPVGLQIAAPRFREDRVLAVLSELESVRSWQDAYPWR